MTSFTRSAPSIFGIDSRLLDQRRRIHRAGGDHAPHDAGRPQHPRQRARVDVGDGHDAVLDQIVAQRAVGAPVAGTRRRLAHHEPRDLRPARLLVAVGHSVVADLRGRHRHDLSGVGRVGQHLLVAGHAGVEDHFSARLARRACGNTSVPSAVLEGKRGVHECRAALRAERRCCAGRHCRAGVTATLSGSTRQILARAPSHPLTRPCLDTARDALTQLVPVHPNAGVAAAASSLRVDIRRFPWINRLAADYAFDARPPVAVLRRRRARSARVAAGHCPRAGASPTARHARLARGRPAGPARGATRRPRRHRAPARPANGRNRHRPAGWTVRRTAVHRPQGADGAAAGRSGARHLRRAHRGGVLGGRRGSRLAGGERVRGPGRRGGAPHREHRGRAPAAGCPIARVRAGPVDRGGAGRAGRSPAAHGVHGRRCWPSLRACYAPGRGMADAFSRWLESLLGPRGLVVYDSSDPRGQAARRRPLLQGDGDRRRHGRAGRRGRPGARGAGLPRAGHATPRLGGAVLDRRRRERRSAPPAIGCRSATASRPAKRWPRGRASTRKSSAPTSCCGRWSRTRSSPPCATWPGRASWPIWRSCARCTRPSASRCHSSSLARQRRWSTPTPRASCRGATCAFESLRPQDESALNALLEAALPPSVEAAVDGVLRALDERMTVLAQEVAVDRPHTRERRPLGPRPDAGRRQEAAGQGAAGGQAQGRHPAAPVQARAGTGVSRAAHPRSASSAWSRS